MISAHVGFATGASWIDFDGDGDLDVYVTTAFSGNLDNVLYRNDGGAFTRVTGAPLVQDGADSPCSAWADYDNDGDLDVFVSNLDAGNGTLYAGLGGGAFAAATGLPATLKGAGCAWGDYDQDGYVDLVVSSIFGVLGMNTPNRLFHNQGDGTFVEVTSAPIGTVTDSHHHPTWSDFDGDGDLDLFFASGPVGSVDSDRMYRNLRVESGTPTFQAITSGVFATNLRDSQTLRWIDYDNDGDLDLFAVNYTSVPNQLYRNDGATFVKLTTGSLVTDVTNAHGAAWGDFDLDGDLDVYVATDNGQSNRYYRNEGGVSFTRITSGAFVTEARSNYGVAAGDYDRDGDLDLFLPTAREEGPSILFRNDLAAGSHWLEVRLHGVLSNRSGIGAKVRARASVGGTPRWQMREILSGTSYGGHDALEAHFGLADAALVDTLRIEWPSGVTQVLTGVAVDRVIDVVEDAATDVAVSVARAEANGGRVEIEWRLGAGAPGSVDVERRRDLAGWAWIARIEVDAAGRARLTDEAVERGRSYAYRFALGDDGGYAGETSITVPQTEGLDLAIARSGGAHGLDALITVPERATVAIEVFDALGRRRLPLERRTLEGGRSRIALDPGRALPSGLYWVRVEHASGTRVARAVVAR